MLPNATISATMVPTTFSVSNATTNPARAASIMLPSTERLMTPAFSLIVSPMVANIRADAPATMEAMVAVSNMSTKALIIRFPPVPPRSTSP